MLLETDTVVAPPRTKPDKTLAALRKAHLRLVTRGWIQGTIRDVNGFCLLGAVAITVRPDGTESMMTQTMSVNIALGYLAEEILCEPNEITSWNDDPDRTKDEVIAKLEAAITRRRADLAEGGDE